MTDTTREAVAQAMENELRTYAALAGRDYPGPMLLRAADVIAALRPAQDAEGWRAALEEAAKIADEVSAEYGKRQDKTLSEVQFEGMVACDQVATAIRALAASSPRGWAAHTHTSTASPPRTLEGNPNVVTADKLVHSTVTIDPDTGATNAEGLRESLLAGLEMLRRAVIERDPGREILVRINDLATEVSVALAATAPLSGES
jgi:hypothetical protein